MPQNALKFHKIKLEINTIDRYMLLIQVPDYVTVYRL